MAVDPDQRVRAYRYGPQLVPMASMDRELLLFKADKGVKLLGFTPLANVPRHYFLSEASLMLPDPNDPLSTTALSALVRAMHAEGKAAILRCKMIARRELGVTIHVATPRLAEKREEVRRRRSWHLKPESVDHADVALTWR